MYKLKRKDSEINTQLNQGEAWGIYEGTALPNFTYEQGVLAAIHWMLGDTDDVPVECSPSDE